MRQRMIGAAVLVIAAVILIPWLVSNAHDPHEQVNTLPVPAVASADTPIVLALPPLTHSQGAAGDGSERSRRRPEVAAAHGSAPGSSRGTEPVARGGAQGSADAAPARRVGKSAERAGTSRAGQRGTRPAGWYLQVASFLSRVSARDLADKMQGLGFNSFVDSHVAEGKIWYRVRVGPYASKSLAAARTQRVSAISGTRPLVLRAYGSRE